MDPMWQSYTAQLLNLAGGKGFDKEKQIFSAAGFASSIDLVNPNQWIFNSTVYYLGDQIPAWSLAYSPRSGLCTAFMLFLCYIDPVDKDTNSRAAISSQVKRLIPKELDGKISNLRNSLAKKISALEDPKSRFKPLNTVSLKDVRVGIEKIAKALIALQSDKFGKQYNPIQEAIKKCLAANRISDSTSYNMPIAKDTSGSACVYAPTYSLGGDFAQVYQEWLKASVEGKVTATISVDQAQITPSSMNSTAADVFTPFLSEQITKARLDVEFTGFGVFPIEQGRWFDPTLILAYKNQISSGAPRFFGPDGSLNLIPEKAIIGYEPKLTLWIDQALYKHINEKESLSQLGPFKLSGTTPIFNQENTAVVYGPVKTTVPILLGIISNVADA